MFSSILAGLCGLLFFNFSNAMDCILLVGPIYKDTRVTMEYFCPTNISESCLVNRSLLIDRHRNVAGLVKGVVILGGGGNTNSSESFNPESGEQNMLGDLIGQPNQLNYAGGAVLNDTFYVCGGGFWERYRGARNYCQKYQDNLGQWTWAPPMNAARFGHGFVASGHYLYAFGGLGEEDQHGFPIVLSSMERFDTNTNEWRTLASKMLTPRRTFGAAVLGNYIFACGGADGQNRFSSCERYDIKRDKWEYVENMTFYREQFTLTALNGNLYAIGGYIGTPGKHHFVDVYDPLYDTWGIVGNLTEPRVEHTATVVHFKPCFSNICFIPTPTTTTAEPASAMRNSTVSIIWLLILGFFGMKTS